MPDGTTRMHSQDECLDTFMSMVQRARALSKGEEPEPPTPLEWSYIFGTPEGPACPDFSAIALPESAYGEDPGLSFLERDYEEE